MLAHFSKQLQPDTVSPCKPLEGIQAIDISALALLQACSFSHFSLYTCSPRLLVPSTRAGHRRRGRSYKEKGAEETGF